MLTPAERTVLDGTLNLAGRLAWWLAALIVVGSAVAIAASYAHIGYVPGVWRPR